MRSGANELASEWVRAAERASETGSAKQADEWMAQYLRPDFWLY